MNKWLKIGGVVSAILIVGALVLGGTTLAFARGAMRSGPSFFERGGPGGPGNEWFKDGDRRGGPGGSLAQKVEAAPGDTVRTAPVAKSPP